MNPVCDLLEPLVKDRHSVFSDLMLTKRKVGYDPKQMRIQDFFKRPKMN